MNKSGFPNSIQEGNIFRTDNNFLDLNHLIYQKIAQELKDDHNIEMIKRDEQIFRDDALKFNLDENSSIKCPFNNCNQIFIKLNTLEEHFKTHFKSKEFKCEIDGCSKVYKSKENLTLHIKNIHLNLKPYKCRFCPSLFSHRNGKT